MSDDDRLAALFRDAASDAGAPPPAFGHDDVVAASHRIGRRRTAMARGALGVLIVAGIGAAVVLPGQVGRQTATTTAAAPTVDSITGAAGAGQPESGERAQAAAPSGAQQDAAKSAPPTPPIAPGAAAAPNSDAGGGAPSVLAAPAPPAPTPLPQSAPAASGPPFTGTPLGPGRTDCADRQDPALRAYLEEALPEVVGAPAAPTTMECRPGGERGVSVEVAGGLLSVRYLPPAAAYANAEPADARTADARTASGGVVVVSSRPAKPGGPAPFADRLDATAAYLAPRL